MARKKRSGATINGSDDAGASKKARSTASGCSEGEAKSTKKTVVVKGSSAVDDHCPISGSSHVYADASGPFDAMLNQTNISRNNNKYYILQLLESDSGKTYSVWFRWGRVGNKGQNSLQQFGGDLDGAKHCFMNKFHDKTRNDWTDRQNFEKLDHSVDQQQEGQQQQQQSSTSNGDPLDAVSSSPIKSKLDERVRLLLELICDVQAMKQAMVELQYDAEKLPLGKLTPAQIKAGFCALKTIEGLIEKGSKNRSKLTEACNEYYTRIPHVFGMKTPPLISTLAQLKVEIELCEALADVEVAMRRLRESKPGACDLHPADRCYEAMRCDMRPLGMDDEAVEAIKAAVSGTHGLTHQNYKLEVLNVFETKRHPEEGDFESMDNRRLLWHGSRLSNWYGIICEGLKVAPPHVPITGHMFGRGVYFADACSKSANYCFASVDKHRALLALCEVALGKPRELLDADYKADKLPKGFHSTKGLGRFVPDPNGDRTMQNGAKLATGPLVQSNVENKRGYTLQYNEYVVYNIDRVRLRYLVEVKFVF